MAEPGQVLDGRYRLDARIAAGGMGEVWRGTDFALSRAVAVKLLHPGQASQADALARFRAEAQHAGSLSHPNIAQVYDYCEPAPPDPAYLVMELVDGPSLARQLDSGPISPEHTLDVIEQAANGLAAAHRSGLLHRDIKPGNLLLSRDGLIKITDFGIARAAGSAAQTRTGALTGTPAYLAPERVTGTPAAPVADLYALGVVAHQCLTGQVPFSGEPLVVALAQVERDMPPLPDSVPPALATLIADLTRKDPQARPASALAVVARAGLVRATLPGTSFAGTSAAGITPARDTAADRPASAGAAPGRNAPPGGYPPGGGAPRRIAWLLAGLATTGLASLIIWLVASSAGARPAGHGSPGRAPAAQSASPRHSPVSHQAAATRPARTDQPPGHRGAVPAGAGHRRQHGRGPGPTQPAPAVTTSTPSTAPTPTGPAATVTPSPPAPTPSTSVSGNGGSPPAGLALGPPSTG